MYAVVTVTEPYREPIDLAVAKLHCRVDGSDEDGLFQTILIPAARRWVEKATRRTLITTVKRLSLDCFPSWAIRIPDPPLQSITSIVYTDAAGDSTTIDDEDYRVLTDPTPGFVEPAYGVTWPIAQDISGAVRVTFTAGYGDEPDSVPEPIKQAMLLLIGHWYQNREAIVTGTITAALEFSVDALLGPYWTGQYS